jgi:hypothetical protein
MRSSDLPALETPCECIGQVACHMTHGQPISVFKQTSVKKLQTLKEDVLSLSNQLHIYVERATPRVITLKAFSPISFIHHASQHFACRRNAVNPTEVYHEKPVIKYRLRAIRF